jgi:hypothetical protein
MSGVPAPPPPPPPPPPPALNSAAPAGTPVCPKCHASLAAGSEYCNKCGASVSAAPTPATTAPAGNPPVDIRQRVDQDRGVLKRLQLLIPGFRAYRLGEDSREADSFLRLQVADRVHRAVQVVQDCRQSLTQAGQFQSLTDFSALLSELQQLEGSIRHAEQGYTGISPAVRVTPTTIDRLYEYDYGFAQAADQMTATIAPLKNAVDGANSPAITQAITTVRAEVRQLDQAFKARLRAIEGIAV